MTPCAQAWYGHALVTRHAVQVFKGQPVPEEWESVSFEPIEQIYSFISIDGKPAPKSRQELADQLVIQEKKMHWDWWPKDSAPDQPVNALDVLLYSVDEPDGGFDQDLNLSPDQKYMGGYSGLPSQSIRHMYYPAFDWNMPLDTFHFPRSLSEMGQSPDRAVVFFTLAKKIKNAGHLFWAYRFLGMGLHYVQDTGQPYHVSQFASVKLLAFGTLFSLKGWNAFIQETTRLVANFHLAFEDLVNEMLDETGQTALGQAFRVSRPDSRIQKMLAGNLTTDMRQMVVTLALSGCTLSSDIVNAEMLLMGDNLKDPAMDIVKNTGPVPNFKKIALDAQYAELRKAFFDPTYIALSNTAVATRWYIERFREK